MDDDFSVGEVMQDGQTKALKTLAITASVLVYLGMIVYSAVHNWRLMMSGVAADMAIWAALGVVALEISAVFLPVALHWWTHAPLQRMAAFAFYALDLGLIFMNVVLDYAVVSGSTTIPPWMTAYLFYGVPATPIFAGLGWSMLWLLDPSQRERGMIESLRASTRQVLAARIAEQARAADVSAQVDQAAGVMARQIVGATLGTPARAQQPIHALPPAPKIGRNGNGNGKPPEQVYQVTAAAPTQAQAAASAPLASTYPGRPRSKFESEPYNLLWPVVGIEAIKNGQYAPHYVVWELVHKFGLFHYLENIAEGWPNLAYNLAPRRDPVDIAAQFVAQMRDVYNLNLDIGARHPNWQAELRAACAAFVEANPTPAPSA